MRLLMYCTYLLSFWAVATLAQEELALDELDSVVEQRRKVIEEELKKLDKDAWAGSYYEGDGKGANSYLDFAPTSGFAYRFSGCLGTYAQSLGSVTIDGNTIYFKKESEDDEIGMSKLSEELQGIRWGRRQYLISEDEFVDFANAINAGFEPRRDSHGRFLLKGDDYKKRVRGKPDIPEQYQAYLLKKPIKARILSVGNTKEKKFNSEVYEKDTDVVFDVGAKDGVLPGMTFHLYRPDNEFSVATITEVDHKTSKAVASDLVADDPIPEVGWKYSTHVR